MALKKSLSLSSVSSVVVCGSCMTTDTGNIAVDTVALTMRFLAFASVSCLMRVSRIICAKYSTLSAWVSSGKFFVETAWNLHSAAMFTSRDFYLRQF